MNIQRFRLIPLMAILVCNLPLAGQNRIGTGQVVQIYEQHCAICHGQELEGGLGGALIGPLDYANDDAAMQQWIREGNPDLGMPAFAGQLSEAEIRSLVIYIREMRQKAERADLPEGSVGGNIIEAGGYAFRIEEVMGGLSEPWSIAFLPGGGMLVTEKTGNLRIISDGKLGEPVRNAPAVLDRGQGGMLEVALHPDYAENKWVYLAYSRESDNGEGSTSVVRGRIQENRWTDHEDLFVVPEKFHTSRGQHFGTRLVFKAGYLFFAIGDRGRMDNAQDLSNPHGKIHRIHDDGRIPEDNPFRENPDAFPTIWTYGNRNPQGLDMHPLTGDIWESEHGPRGGDEINLIRKGVNYGWPVITHGMNYGGSPITEKTSAPGMEQPVLYWTPSIAVCGIDFYEGDRFPGWKNNLFVGGLASQELHRLVIEDGKVVKDEIILTGMGRVRDVASGPDGALYLVLNDPHRIVRIVPAGKNN